MNKIVKIILLDILKNKILIAYTAMLSILAWSSFALEDNTTKGLLTLMNIILFIVPLVSILFTTIYIYNSSEFIELLLSQPIKRSKIWRGLFFGLGLSLLIAFILGAGIPLLIYSLDTVGIMMILSGIVNSLIFVAMAFWGAILTRDKAKGIGLAIILWLYFALIFDGIVLFMLFQFADYPIENLIVALTAFSPIDLTRIQMLLHLDVSAMMGYTGAVFREIFGSGYGLILSFTLMLLWILVPFYFSLRKFRKKDL
jgi:Cu-processing system permease protein